MVNAIFFCLRMLQNKKILLGVTGSIAAYKTAFLIRLLKKAGAQVQVVMTKSATEFITPLTLSTLSELPVHSDYTEDENSGEWTNHVALGMWADLMLIAPATANTLAKMNTGVCDEFLLAVYLSAKCPVAFAPAMDLDMFAHDSTQQNISALKKRGHLLIDAESGELASGLEGKGRMAEPEHIVQQLNCYFEETAPLSGKTCLVTAGPTHEAIDAVRFIGNHSSGKMGFAIAETLAENGAKVVLISGPSALNAVHPNIELKRVKSAAEMYEACTSAFAKADITVKSAAVADYRPKQAADHKIKKSEENLSIELEPTKDILAALGAQKRDDQLLVGFALETDNELEYAKGKIARKNLDLIVLNSLRNKGAGFGHDTNQVTFIDKHNNLASFELKSKQEVAKDLLKKILELCGG